MDFENVLTVVATSPHPPLLRKQIQAVAEGLQAAGAQTADPIWLDEGIAADVFFSGSVEIEKVEAALDRRGG
jgi:hypothetical protein